MEEMDQERDRGTKARVTVIQKARQLFLNSGLAFPTIPRILAAQMRELRPWLFSTRQIEMSPYNLGHYVHEVENSPVADYVILSHSGHGINSHAIHYFLVQGFLRMFLQLGWGGVYMDREAAAAEIHDCFFTADQIVATAQNVAKFQMGERLIIVGSDFFGSNWLRPGETLTQHWLVRPHQGQESENNPLEILSLALKWLTRARLMT
jgi:hypothetical protein